MATIHVKGEAAPREVRDRRPGPPRYGPSYTLDLVPRRARDRRRLARLDVKIHRLRVALHAARMYVAEIEEVERRGMGSVFSGDRTHFLDTPTRARYKPRPGGAL